MSKSFTDLGEREVLALAISLEEEDSRIYRDYAERMKEKYPETASILQSMHEVELSHHRRRPNFIRGDSGTTFLIFGDRTLRDLSNANPSG